MRVDNRAVASLEEDMPGRTVSKEGVKKGYEMDQQQPSLRFLRLPHECNYCRGVHGMTYGVRGRFRRRLLWVACRCGKRHYVCPECAAKIGSTAGNGSRYIAECARRWWPAHRHLLEKSERKGESDGSTR